MTLKVEAMRLFNQRRPRGFRHEFMFVDERKERFEAMRRGVVGDKTRGERRPVPDRLGRGVFLDGMRHAGRQRRGALSGSSFLTVAVVVMLIFLLVLAWRLLLNL